MANIKTLKLTGAAVAVSRKTKVLWVAPAVDLCRSHIDWSCCPINSHENPRSCVRVNPVHVDSYLLRDAPMKESH